jgi:hypothetical protein
MATTTADKPRGKNQRERWYATHTRAGECLFVIWLPHGALGRHYGAVAVSSRRDVLETLVAKIGRATVADVSRYKVQAHTFEEGVAVTRFRSFTDVDAMV